MYRRNELMLTTSYTFYYRKEDQLNPNSKSSLVLDIGGLMCYYSIRNDTLVLNRNFVDGGISYYIKNK